MKSANLLCDPGATQWTCLLDNLYDFDLKASPVGLYGIRDYQSKGVPHPPLLVEWERVIKPTLNRLGCNPAKFHPVDLASGTFRFQASAPIAYLAMVRLSKIKVRKYGNAYRVDPHIEFEQRWKRAAMDSVLNNLWKWRGNQGCLALLLGFADEKNPFASELGELQSTQTFSKRFSPAVTKIWSDPHGRAFKVIAALWHISGKP